MDPAWLAHLPPGFDLAGLDLLADGGLPARWRRRWGERPSWPQLRDVDGTWISSAELEDRTRSAACRLRGAGLRRGDRVLLAGATAADFVAAYVAGLRAGLVLVPLNPAYTETEVAKIVQDAEPAAGIVDDDRAAWIRRAAGDALRIFPLSLERLPAERGCEDIDAAGAEDPALLVYTSGTTGQPKGALLTHGNLLASATAVNLAWRWERSDSLLLALPLFHVHGLGVGINGSLCAGASVLLRPKFEPADVAGHAPAASMFFGVPTMYQRLAATRDAAALAGFRLLVSGSAPLPASLAQEISRQTGQMPLERYGMTETIMLTSNPYDGERKPGSVGFPLPGVELRLAADGEVEVRGPNVIGGYFRRPEANAESFTSDGWFRTGDLGEVAEDGYLRLIGRSKDLIITGGYNVYPREVEEVLATHPAVREVAVVGRLDTDWGEAVTAVVVADGPVEVDDLRAHAARRLAPYKVPKQIEFAAELPRNALGKVVRGELR